MKSKGKIILGFLIVFLMSFIPELNHDLFGDWFCQGATIDTEMLKNGHYVTHGCQYGLDGIHEPMLHYGFRHWVWIACGLTLFVWNIVEVINGNTK